MSGPAPDHESPEVLPFVEVTSGPGPRPGGSSPDATVIWLHGLGADGHDFPPIVPYLELPSDLTVRFVFPHAPMRPVTLNNGMVMRAWYDILGMDLRRDEDEAGIRDSARLVEATLAAEKARGVPANRMVLAGFSQGGAVAYHVGLRHAETLAGIMVLSAYLLLHEKLDDEISPANLQTPILQCHGIMDPMVPVEAGRRAAETLESRGHPIEWKTYPAAHSLDPREVQDIGKWLTKVLG